MIIEIGKSKTIESLQLVSIDKTDRHAVRILMIDDEEFAYLDLLKRHGFNIRFENDITDISAVSEYAVIICDIKNVGKNFGSKFEGAHVLKEIRKKYPEKILYSYSSQTYDASFNEYFTICDNVLSKNIDLDTWIKLLDEAIVLAIDPKKRWERIRQILMSKGVQLVEIIKLEEKYVNSILKNNPSIFTGSKSVNLLQSDIKNMLLNIVSNIIYGNIICNQ